MDGLDRFVWLLLARLGFFKFLNWKLIWQICPFLEMTQPSIDHKVCNSSDSENVCPITPTVDFHLDTSYATQGINLILFTNKYEIALYKLFYSIT